MLAAKPVPVSVGASLVIQIRYCLLGSPLSGTSIATVRAWNGSLTGVQPSMPAGGEVPGAVYTRPVQPPSPAVRCSAAAATADGAVRIRPTPGLLPLNSGVPR